jgi:glycerophosphoryl diester phosphodiesterase
VNAPGWLTARPIAHRGLHAEGRPENSLAALRAALGRGFAVEADIRLSRDGEIFVFHDDDLARLTGAKGLFQAHDASDLRGLRLKGSEQRIPGLAEFLEETRGAAPLILELKSDFSGDLSLAAALRAGLAHYAGPVAVKSFDPALIAALRAADADWPLGMIGQADYEEDDYALLSREEKLRLARFVHAAETCPDFLSWRCSDLPSAVCELARACASMPVMTWTIRGEAQAAEALRHADQIVFEGFTPH